MSIALKPNQKLLTLKTYLNRSIHFIYIKGTKTPDDIFSALDHTIKYKGDLNANYDRDLMDLDCDGFYYNENKHILSEQDKKDLMDNCIHMKIIYKGDLQREALPPYNCMKECCMMKDKTSIYDITNFVVKTMSGKQISLPKFRSCDKINDIKKYIYTTTETPPEHQRLIHMGKLQMQGNHSCAHYGLKDGGYCHLTLRLRGGMYTEQSGRSGTYKHLPSITFYDLDLDKVLEIDNTKLEKN